MWHFSHECFDHHINLSVLFILYTPLHLYFNLLLLRHLLSSSSNTFCLLRRVFFLCRPCSSCRPCSPLFPLPALFSLPALSPPLTLYPTTILQFSRGLARAMSHMIRIWPKYWNAAEGSEDVRNVKDVRDREERRR